MSGNANYEGNRRQLCQRIRMLSHGHARANERIAELENQIRQTRRQARPNPRLIEELRAEVDRVGNRLGDYQMRLDRANRQLEEANREIAAGGENARRLEARERRWHNLFLHSRRGQLAEGENAQQLAVAQNTIGAYERQVEIIANDQEILAYFTELQQSVDPFLHGVGLEEYDAKNLEISDDVPEEVELDVSDDEPEGTELPKGNLKKRKAEQKFGYSFAKFPKKS